MENLGSVILENNRIAVIRQDGTLEILVQMSGRPEPVSIASFCQPTLNYYLTCSQKGTRSNMETLAAAICILVPVIVIAIGAAMQRPLK